MEAIHAPMDFGVSTPFSICSIGRICKLSENMLNYACNDRLSIWEKK